MEKRSIKEIKLILEEIQTLSDERLTELRAVTSLIMQYFVL